MKTTFQLFIAAIGVVISLNSCTEDHTEMIAKLNQTEQELLLQDSLFKSNSTMFSAFLPNDSTTQVNSADGLQKAISDKENMLVASLDSLIMKNKSLLTSLTENSIHNKEAEVEYSQILSDLENLKKEEATNKEGFKKIEESFTKALETEK